MHAADVCGSFTRSRVARNILVNKNRTHAVCANTQMHPRGNNGNHKQIVQVSIVDGVGYIEAQHISLSTLVDAWCACWPARRMSRARIAGNGVYASQVTPPSEGNTNTERVPH